MGKLEVDMNTGPTDILSKKAGFDWGWIVIPIMAIAVLAVLYGGVLAVVSFALWDISWMVPHKNTLVFILRVMVVIGAVLGLFANADSGTNTESDEEKEVPKDKKPATRTVQLPMNRERRFRMYVLLLDMKEEEAKVHDHDELESMCIERGLIHLEVKDESA